VAGNGRNSLRAAVQERGWSYTWLAAELRRHAAGAQLPKIESLIRLISRWVNNHQQPDDFYRDLLALARIRRIIAAPLCKAAATSYPHEATACRQKAEALRVKDGL